MKKRVQGNSQPCKRKYFGDEWLINIIVLGEKFATSYFGARERA
jgi:hypothetical protein